MLQNSGSVTTLGGEREFEIGDYGDASRSGFSRSSGTFRGPRIAAPRSPRIGSGISLLATFVMITYSFSVRVYRLTAGKYVL
jgi:hypothetical protein